MDCDHYDNWCEEEKRTCNNCYYERGDNMNDEEKKEVLIGFLIGSVSILRDMNIQFTEKSRNKLADRIEALLLAYEKEKEENKRLRKCHLQYEEMTGIDLLLD